MNRRLVALRAATRVVRALTQDAALVLRRMFAIGALLPSLTALPAAADSSISNPISTGRPSFSGPSTTLDPGRWQWEVGYQYTNNDDAGSDTEAHTLPLLFLRLGISDSTEVNLTWSGYSDVQASGPDARGVSDLSLGAIYQITPDEAAFAISAFANLSLPVGSDDLTSDEVDPGLGVAWSYTPESGPAWFGTLVANSVTDDHERLATLGTAIGAAYALSERLGSYVEYFSVHADSADSAHSINGGLTYLITNDVQVDIYAGGGLNDAADDYFIGAGLGWRF